MSAFPSRRPDHRAYLASSRPADKVFGTHTVIVGPKSYAAWIDRGHDDPADMLPLLRPFPADAMEAFPVGPHGQRPAERRAGAPGGGVGCAPTICWTRRRDTPYFAARPGHPIPAARSARMAASRPPFTTGRPPERPGAFAPFFALWHPQRRATTFTPAGAPRSSPRLAADEVPRQADEIAADEFGTRHPRARGLLDRRFGVGLPGGRTGAYANMANRG
jgi:hypothetical protein